MLTASQQNVCFFMYCLPAEVHYCSAGAVLFCFYCVMSLSPPSILLPIVSSAFPTNIFLNARLRNKTTTTTTENWKYCERLHAQGISSGLMTSLVAILSWSVDALCSVTEMQGVFPVPAKHVNEHRLCVQQGRQTHEKLCRQMLPTLKQGD